MARTAVVYSGISFQHQTMNMPEFRGRFDVIDVYDLHAQTFPSMTR